MEFELSFKPVEHRSEDFSPSQLGRKIMVYTPGNFPNLSEADLILFSVDEYRGVNQKEIIEPTGSFDFFRQELYRLYEGSNRLRIADLGQLLIGQQLSDTYQLLSDVLVECEQRGLFCLVIGGGQDLTLSQYQSCMQLGKLVNMVSIDSKLDLGLDEGNTPANSYFSELIKKTPNVLFNFTNIGYQSYLNAISSIKLLNDMYFEAFRLGEIRQNLEEVEPLLRNADLVTLDMNAIRMSDNPSNVESSPNGFYSEEICQIMRYAGISGRLRSLGIYHYNKKLDTRSQSAKLLSQMIWCFFEGFFHKMKQFKPTDEDMIKYHVSMRDGEYNTCFYKNKKLEKWWMEIPLINQENTSFENYFAPCSYRDYQLAVKGEVPERWLKAFQKMNQL